MSLGGSYGDGADAPWWSTWLWLTAIIAALYGGVAVVVVIVWVVVRMVTGQ